jgi:hypothetical protein
MALHAASATPPLQLPLRPPFHVPDGATELATASAVPPAQRRLGAWCTRRSSRSTRMTPPPQAASLLLDTRSTPPLQVGLAPPLLFLAARPARCGRLSSARAMSPPQLHPSWLHRSSTASQLQLDEREEYRSARERNRGQRERRGRRMGESRDGVCFK